CARDPPLLRLDYW
nr:immunoglobulin heavy chain junction region [Mus musculus]